MAYIELKKIQNAKVEIIDRMQEFATKISAEIVEKQEELILTTIQIIGGDEFIDITIDKDKVIEALTDYVNKQKGIPNIEVRHGEWEYVRYYGHGECYANCSVCKSEVKTLHPTALRIFNRYCPYCGAKMDGERSAECEYCVNEICVNADCNMYADYCPVPDEEEVCRYEKRTPKERGGEK